MQGFKKGAMPPGRKSFANGGTVEDEAAMRPRGFGVVRGPGTGISDSVKDSVPPGTYIMPADSTEEVGAENLAGMGFSPKTRAMAPQGEGPKLGFKPGGNVPVNLSNGEFRLSPEQVHAIGVQVLEGMRHDTHEHVEQDDDQMATNELYFADGGIVRQPPPVDIVQGLREAVIDPIVSDVRQGNRVLQQEYPLAYQAAQLHPVVGIPSAGLNYADAMQKGDTQGAIAASLSSIPLAEKAYKVGNAIASGAREIVGNRGFRAAANNLGRRFGAGEQTAESFEAGQQQGQHMVKPNGLNFANGGLVEDERMRRTSTGKIPLENLPTQDPGRTSSGPIGGQDLPYKDMQRASSGKIGDPPTVSDVVSAPAKPSGFATSPTNTYPGNQAEAAGNIYAQSNADMVRGFDRAATYLNRGDPVKDAVNAVGGFFSESAAKARQPNAWDDSGTRPQVAETPAPVVAVQSPAAAVTTQPSQPKAAPAVAPPAVMPPAAVPPSPEKSYMDAGPVPYTVTPVENTNGVQRINQPGKSPLFTNINPAQAVAEMKGNPVGIIPAGASPFGSTPGASSGDVSAALQAAAARGDWDAVRNHYQKSGGTFQGRTAEQDRNDKAVREMLNSNNLHARTAALGFASNTARNAQTAQELAMRQKEMEGRQDIATQDIGLRREAQGFQTRSAKRQEDLQTRYDAAKTPEERKSIAQMIRDLSGKDMPNRLTVVPGGQEWDANANAMRTVPGRVIDNQTLTELQPPKAATSLTPPKNHIDALKKNPNQAAMFDAIYGQGAAARHLGAK